MKERRVLRDYLHQLFSATKRHAHSSQRPFQHRETWPMVTFSQAFKTVFCHIFTTCSWIKDLAVHHYIDPW